MLRVDLLKCVCHFIHFLTGFYDVPFRHLGPGRDGTCGRNAVQLCLPVYIFLLRRVSRRSIGRALAAILGWLALKHGKGGRIGGRGRTANYLTDLHLKNGLA